jgi:hypothetical protein
MTLFIHVYSITYLTSQYHYLLSSYLIYHHSYTLFLMAQDTYTPINQDIHSSQFLSLSLVLLSLRVCIS